MNMDKQLASKLLRAAKLIQNPTKNAKNPFLKNHYADLGAVIQVVKSALLEQGVFVIQYCSQKDGTLDVSTSFIDGDSGASATINVAVHLKELSPQGSMGAFTYGRRYGLLAAFNLAAEDDDGNTASGKSDDFGGKTEKTDIPVKTAAQAVSGISAILAKKETK